MPEELCTVDFAAERLKLHPKTVLRFIRDGRLPATRVGKAYRIRRADIDALAGLPPGEAPSAHPTATTIVDIPDIGPDLARKWARQVPTALNAKPDSPVLLRADVVYAPDRAHLKIIIVGSIPDTATLMALIKVWTEQLVA